MAKKKVEANENNVEKNTKSKGKKGSKGPVKKVPGAKIPQTVQDTIPYLRVYENGIIETDKGVYSKSYPLGDVNFQIASQEEQEEIFLSYSDLLNTFGSDVKIQVTINNRNIDQEEFAANTLLKPRKDTLNEYREEYNEMLKVKMAEGHNNMRREKYITISINAETIEDATAQFARFDGEISNALKKIIQVETHPMTIEDRLAILHDIYNISSPEPLIKKAMVEKHEVESFNFEHMISQGLTTKDIIGPASIEMKPDHIVLGETYARVLFLDNLPTFLSTNILPDLTDVSCNMLVSVIYESIPQDKAMKIIRNQIVNINSNVIDAQKKATKSGYSADLISPDLLRAQMESNRILSDMTKRNQKLFLTTIVLTHFADSLEELNKDTQSINTIASKHLCQLKKLNYQQEAGFNTCLPLATNKVFVKRMLTTEAASVFIPFAAQELTQKNGMYYGLNAVSKNMILFSRLNSKNANGVILGTPGSGKSFSAKREIINVLLNTDDEVFIIDPEREYAPLAAMMGGESVRIAAGAKVYLNPLDMDMDYADDDDPITLKSDFINSLCETIIGGRYGLSPIQKSVIDRCVRQVYQPYVEHMNSLKGTITYDADYMPTLIDFYELLLSQPEPEAQNLALSIELYCTGSYDTFAHRTNVNTRSRFVIYDIKDIGSGMKELGIQVCLDAIWNKMISNKKEGKRTWFYIDEFYLLTQTESSAKFLQQIYKRARKWGGIPTGITQNVGDLLESQIAVSILSNCDFILMLNQAPLDRQNLAELLNISPTQLSYVTNADAGQGLLYTGKAIVPFIDKFPSNTKLYKVMTTKPEEVEAAEEAGLRVQTHK